MCCLRKPPDPVFILKPETNPQVKGPRGLAVLPLMGTETAAAGTLHASDAGGFAWPGEGARHVENSIPLSLWLVVLFGIF